MKIKSTELPLGAVTTASVVGYSGIMFLPIWVGAVALEYSFSESDLGFIAAVQLIFSAAFSAIVSAKLKFINFKKAAIFGAVIIALSNAVSALVHSEFFLVLSRIFSGVGEGILFAIINAAIARTREPIRLFSIQEVTIGISAIIFFLLSSVVIHKFGARSLFGVVSVMAIISIPFIFSMPDNKKEANANEPRFDKENSRPDTSPKKAGNCVLLAIMFVMLGAQGIWTYLERIGNNINMTGNALSVCLAAGAFFSLFGPWLASQLSKKLSWVFQIKIAILVLVPISLLITTTESHVVYIMTAVPKPFIAAYSTVLLMTYLAHLDPEGKAAAAAASSMSIGTALAPLVSGFLLLYGGYELLGLSAALLVIIAFCLLIRAQYEYSRWKFSSTTNESNVLVKRVV